MTSYAQATARELIRTTAEGNEVVLCKIGPVKPIKKPQTSMQKQQAAGTPKLKARKNEESTVEPTLAPEVAEKTAKRRNKLKKCWEKALDFLKTMTAKYPEVGLLVILLEEAEEFIFSEEL